MKKKIATERKIDNQWFNIKIGTIDKKEPNVIYIEGSFFIIPTTEQSDYSAEIKNINKELETGANNLCESLNDIFLRRNILHFEAANERMKHNKSTFVSFQIFLKQKKLLPYDDVVELMLPAVESLTKTLINSVESNNFEYSKRKK